MDDKHDILPQLHHIRQRLTAASPAHLTQPAHGLMGRDIEACLDLLEQVEHLVKQVAPTFAPKSPNTR